MILKASGDTILHYHQCSDCNHNPVQLRIGLVEQLLFDLQEWCGEPVRQSICIYIILRVTIQKIWDSIVGKYDLQYSNSY